MTEWTCDCSEDFGPCEAHCETLAQREGSSARSADELCDVFVDDALALLGDDYRIPEAYADIPGIVASPDSWEGCWLRPANLGEALRELCDHHLTHALGEIGLSVEWDDGYRIFRLTGGPLTEED